MLDIGNRLTVGTGLEELADQLILEESSAQTARMLGAANALREAIHSPVPPSKMAELERMITSARESIGEEAFALEWERGRRLSPEQAVEEMFGAR